MSSALFPHILFLLGLNFINIVCHAAYNATSYRFARQLNSVPGRMFYDILNAGEDIWLAGDGVYRLSAEGNLEKIVDDSRVTSLVLDKEAGDLWYSGSSGIGRLDLKTLEKQSIVASFDYIWDLVLFRGRIWFIERERYGWLDTEKMSIGGQWQANFYPRPFISHIESADRLFVGSSMGLFEISEDGKRLLIPDGDLDGGIVAWVEPNQEGYVLGTSTSIYEWTGTAGGEISRISSNYGEYFKSGVSNSVGLDDRIAIARYPSGMAVLELGKQAVTGLVSSGGVMDIGDVFKLKPGGKESIYMLGESGVAEVDMSLGSRFYPASSLYGNAAVRMMSAANGRGNIFTDKEWFEITDEGFSRELLTFPPDWIEVDAENNLILGSVSVYETLRHGEPDLKSLPMGIFDLKWGELHAYALGGEGVYRVDSDLSMRLIYPEKRQLELLGEWQGGFYIRTSGGEVIRLDMQKGWEPQVLDDKVEKGFVWADTNEDGVWIATEEQIYLIRGEQQLSFPSAVGWNILSASLAGDQVAVLFEQPSQHQWAVGIYDRHSSSMLVVPYKDYIGDPVSIMGTGSHIGVVGTGGVGWYDRKDLVNIDKPSVDFALLFENKRVEDRTIPHGMHYIDLQVNFMDPSVPSVVQYRINEGRWRIINLDDPSLQFAGHGSFGVELRALHPNGNVSPSQLIQFGIAPPWYLNPFYQGMLIIILILLVWLMYFLRSRQLKRTNLWLQNEVKKQTRELEAVTAARTNFLAGLSHDIRNPLNGVLMIAETLGRNPPTSSDDPRLRDLTEFGIIVDRMLGEILDFSAIDQSNIPTAFNPVAIRDIIQNSVKQNQFLIQHEMVRLDVTLPDELKDVVIKTDRTWMIKVLSNLIVNALEYSGSERIEVGARCLRMTDQDLHLELFVSDWGIGIDDSEKEFVFERFYRGEIGIESGKHGTGLGLSICQEIAHAMGGHIRLEDNQPSGCKFVLNGRFERVEGNLELDTEAVLSRLSGKRILVVDDLVYNRRSTVEFFETIGCTCDEAENGRKALSMLEQNNYYLALLDWDLPGIMGPEIARRYRRKYPDNPVLLVAVTAYTDGEKKRESEDAGMNGYISKPLSSSKLAHCLASIQKWSPSVASNPDMVDKDEVQEEIYIHIEDCLQYGENYEWESLRRCAHRLTTLALIKNNRSMQQVCRDLQIAATETNVKESQVCLLELQKWRKS